MHAKGSTRLLPAGSINRNSWQRANWAITPTLSQVDQEAATQMARRRLNLRRRAAEEAEEVEEAENLRQRSQEELQEVQKVEGEEREEVGANKEETDADPEEEEDERL